MIELFLQDVRVDWKGWGASYIMNAIDEERNGYWSLVVLILNQHVVWEVRQLLLFGILIAGMRRCAVFDTTVLRVDFPS